MEVRHVQILVTTASYVVQAVRIALPKDRSVVEESVLIPLRIVSIVGHVMLHVVLQSFVVQVCVFQRPDFKMYTD